MLGPSESLGTKPLMKILGQGRHYHSRAVKWETIVGNVNGAYNQVC